LRPAGLRRPSAVGSHEIKAQDTSHFEAVAAICAAADAAKKSSDVLLIGSKQRHGFGEQLLHGVSPRPAAKDPFARMAPPASATSRHTPTPCQKQKPGCHHDSDVEWPMPDVQARVTLVLRWTPGHGGRRLGEIEPPSQSDRASNSLITGPP
jgi:hypothetical protein